jgi:hypothetical protein
MAASFTPLQPTLGIAHGDLRFVCGCSAIETHFLKLSSNSSCADVRPFYCKVCLWRLNGCVLDFIHLSATGVAEIAESTNLKGCPHTFVYIVYVLWWVCMLSMLLSFQSPLSRCVSHISKWLHDGPLLCCWPFKWIVLQPKNSRAVNQTEWDGSHNSYHTPKEQPCQVQKGLYN